MPTDPPDDQPSQEEASPPIVEAVYQDCSDIEEEPLVWLWPSRFPLGKLTMLSGDPDIGKSFITVDMAARVSAGLPWPDLLGRSRSTGNVIMVSAEDDPADTIVPRLRRAGADLSRVAVLSGIHFRDTDRELYFSLKRDLDPLEDLIEEKEALLVIIDPISAYLGEINTNSNSEVRAVLGPLCDLAARQQCTVVTVNHLNKLQESKRAVNRSMYRSIGSMAFVAATRISWLVERDRHEPERRLMLAIKCNLTKKPMGLAYRILDPGIIEWESSPVETEADEALNAAPRDSPKRREATDWLRGLLAKGPLRVRLIEEQAEAEGITKRTLQRAKEEIGACSCKQRFGKKGQWVWYLRNGAPSVPPAPSNGAVVDDENEPPPEEEGPYDS